MVLEAVSPLGEEVEEIPAALRRILAEEVIAREAFPPRDRAAVDGYALCYRDTAEALPGLPSQLRVIGVVPAGDRASKKLAMGQALRIMTGAPLPDGADAVLKREDARLEGDCLLVTAPIPPGTHVIQAGREFQSGERVLEKGVLLGPSEIGLLASLGYSKVAVYRRPVAAILSIGDELVELGGGGTGVFNSNSYALAAQAAQAGALPLSLGITRDKVEDIQARMVQGLAADLLVTAGGSGGGDYDLVAEALQALEADIKFQGVALRPGKTTRFALKSGKPIFCLPGRPTAAFVAFEVLIRPAILAMMGHPRPFTPLLWAVAKREIQIRPGPPKFLPAKLFYQGDELGILPIDEGRGESLRSLAQADALAIIPEGTTVVKVGERIQVQLIKSFLS
ncbi:MAG: molybdopterin molybdotransferase MoeA [candidate division NC10 bacterium]|nr:molybdopterin molybdotransferase MoeA [candidate division NC10 bacterium]